MTSSLKNDRFILSTKHNATTCRNSSLVDALSKWIWNRSSRPVNNPEDRAAQRNEVSWLKGVARSLITLPTKLLTAASLTYHKNLRRPDDFDVEGLLVQRGIIAAVEEVEQTDSFKNRRDLSRLPGIGTEELSDLAHINISNCAEFVADLDRKPSQVRKLPWFREAQDRFCRWDGVVESEIDYKVAGKLNMMILFYCKRDPPPVKGTISVELTGGLAAGRKTDGTIDTILYKTSWSSEEVDAMLDWLSKDRSSAGSESGEEKQGRKLVAEVLSNQEPQPLDRSRIPDNFSITQDVRHAWTLRGLSGKTYLSNVWFADASNINILRALTRFGPEIQERMIRVARNKNLVIHGTGMYQKNDFESGKAPLKLRKEADVWTKLGLPLLAPSDRRSSVGDDAISWTGASEQAARHLAQGDRKAEKQITRSRLQGATKRGRDKDGGSYGTSSMKKARVEKSDGGGGSLTRKRALEGEDGSGEPLRRSKRARKAGDRAAL